MSAPDSSSSALAPPTDTLIAEPTTPISDPRSPPSPITSKSLPVSAESPTKIQRAPTIDPDAFSSKPTIAGKPGVAASSNPSAPGLGIRTPSKASFPWIPPTLGALPPTPGGLVGADGPGMPQPYRRVTTMPSFNELFPGDANSTDLDLDTTPLRKMPPEPKTRSDYGIPILDTRIERELERRERELDRRERDLERRERELERRQREYEHDKARYATELAAVPLWQHALSDLEKRLTISWDKALKQRGEEWQKKVMKSVGEALEKERQVYGLMRMTDVEVNEMVEDTVGYLMQKDEDIADRVRLQSLLYLAQEKLASQAGLEPETKSGSLAIAWRLALGPSIVTEDRYNKAIDLLKDKPLDEPTTRVTQTKKAMEYAVEYTSHLRKETDSGGDMTHYTAGRISRSSYLESVQRQVSAGSYDLEGLMALVDLICPETPVFPVPIPAATPSESTPGPIEAPEPAA